MAKREDFTNNRQQRQNRFFSESFRKKKVKEIERNLSTVSEISREYEVSSVAIYKWIYKYSAMRKKGIKQVIEPLSDTRKISGLKEKIKELERLVGQKQIQLEFKEKMIELAEEMYGVDIKKKFGSPRSAGSGITGKNRSGK
jgi:transposase-like protein